MGGRGEGGGAEKGKGGGGRRAIKVCVLCRRVINNSRQSITGQSQGHIGD